MKYILLVFLITFTSCHKEFSCEKCIGTNDKNGTIIYAGSSLYDGCGWLVVIDSITYHPDVIDTDYLEDQLKVNIVYQILPGIYSCSRSPLQLSNIHVISIKK